MDRPVLIECYDWDKGDKSDYIGSCTLTLRQMIAGHPIEAVLINPALKKKKGEKYRGSGTLKLVKAVVNKIHTFVDYLRGGCEINLVTAIDFTASNGFVCYKIPIG